MASNDLTSSNSAPLNSALSLSDRVRTSAIIFAYIIIFWILLPALLWTLGQRFDRWLSLPVPNQVVRMLGIAGAAFAGVPLLKSMVSLWTFGRGLPISHLPPTRLVQGGSYSRVRHPIYLFFLLTWLSATIALGSLGASIMGGVILATASLTYALAIEEPRLFSRFGEAYEQYAERTPALMPIPRAVRTGLGAAWNTVRPGVERLANCTVLVRGKRWTLVTYGAFVALGTFVMTFWACLSLAALGVDSSRIFIFALAVTLMMLTFGRMAGMLYRWPLLLAAPVTAVRTVGFVSWGGYLGMVGGAILGIALLKLPMGMILDRLVLPGMLCSAIGRVGCLTYGCCTGRPHDQGICYHSADARIVREQGASACVPRWPTQLISGLWALCVLLILAWPSLQPLPQGTLTATACLLYSLGRIAIERTRDEERLGRLQWTRGQYAALACFVISLVALMLLGEQPTTIATRFDSNALGFATATASVTALLSLAIAGLHGRRVGYW